MQHYTKLLLYFVTHENSFCFHEIYSIPLFRYSSAYFTKYYFIDYSGELLPSQNLSRPDFTFQALEIDSHRMHFMGCFISYLVQYSIQWNLKDIKLKYTAHHREHAFTSCDHKLFVNWMK